MASAWGAFWGDSWGNSWGPLHEVDDQRYYGSGKGRRYQDDAALIAAVRDKWEFVEKVRAADAAKVAVKVAAKPAYPGGETKPIQPIQPIQDIEYLLPDAVLSMVDAALQSDIALERARDDAALNRRDATLARRKADAEALLIVLGAL